jgi:UDP-2-acetamido-2-deoxy-ribo-hexuluronate aminotransferase
MVFANDCPEGECFGPGLYSNGAWIVAMEFIDLKAQQVMIREALEEAILGVLDHGHYILGPEVAELERQLADFVGVEHCVTVSSGTDALIVALMALDVRPGDEVITTPFSFIATAEAIALLGARPVFVDIEEASFNIDPSLIAAAITPRTKAILPVSLYGQCADLDVIVDIADQHGIPVIEDGAQSFGATTNGRRSCGLSTIGCTSFFPSKPLGGYGDGGACFTEDEVLAEKMRQIRVHGQTRRYHHSRLGINGRLDTLQAAILIEKLRIFPREIEKRQEVANRYSIELGALEQEGKIGLPKIMEGNTSVFAQYTVRVNNRDAVAEGLKTRGIPVAIHYPTALHMQPVFEKSGGYHVLPVAERASREVLSLPMHPYLSASDQQRIAGEMCEIIDQVG